MPRRRTSNKPIKRRIKLDHKGDALTEMCRTFRAVKNGELPRADGVRDVAMLDKIHGGMPEHTARGTFAPAIVNIYSVPSGFFLNSEQIQAAHRGERIIEPGQCTPLVPEAMINTPDDDRCNNVVPLRLLEAPAQPQSSSEQEEQRVIEDLKNKIRELSRELGIAVDV